MRYHTDCTDVRCAAAWGRKALKTARPGVTLLGLSAYAHFNSLRTGGALLPKLLAAGWQRRWRGVRRGLQFCKETWGRGRSLALYTPSNKPGSGFPKAASGDKLDNIMEGLQRLRRSTTFRHATKLLDDGIDSFGKFDAVRRALQAMAKSNNGGAR